MTLFSFTTRPNPKWDQKIEVGLHQECKRLTDVIDDFKAYTLYGKVEDCFAGGMSFSPHGDILWIDSIWVEPKFRKQGMGRRFLQEAQFFAIKSKLKEMQLNTYFQEAHAFFLTCDFQDVSSIPDWKYGLTCYFMRKML